MKEMPCGLCKHPMHPYGAEREKDTTYVMYRCRFGHLAVEAKKGIPEAALEYWAGPFGPYGVYA